MPKVDKAKEALGAILSLNKLVNCKSCIRYEEKELVYELGWECMKLLESMDVLREIKGLWVYDINLEKYLKALLEAISKKVGEYSVNTCGTHIVFADIPPRQNVKTRVFLSFETTNYFVECITEEHDEFIIPFIMIPANRIIDLIRKEDGEKLTQLGKMLIKKSVDNPHILSLFTVPLPLPETRKGLKLYNDILKKLIAISREISNKKLYRNEYEAFTNINYLMNIKALTPFMYLYKNLEHYGLTLLRQRKRKAEKTLGSGAKPSKWFEEILKAMLTRTLAEGRFSEEVIEYLYYKYDTGGPGQEDIAIPLMMNDDIYMLIVDAKLWKKDICKTILDNTSKIMKNKPDTSLSYTCDKKQKDNIWKSYKESLFKYLRYIQPKTKSKKLKELEEKLGGYNAISGYLLLFLQPARADTECVKQLNRLLINLKEIHEKVYTRVLFMSIQELLEAITRGNLQACIFNKTPLINRAHS